MKRFVPTLGLGLGLILLPGCGHGATDVEGPSADQVRNDLIETLSSTHAFDLDFGGESPWPCPGGGDIRQLLYYGYAESPMAILVEGDLTYEGCTGTSSDGLELTVSGTVATSLAYPMDVMGQVGDPDGTVSGDLSWRASKTTGSCHLELAVVTAGDSVHVTGTACGGVADRTFR
jgi:hypothetical protein